MRRCRSTARRRRTSVSPPAATRSAWRQLCGVRWSRARRSLSRPSCSPRWPSCCRTHAREGAGRSLYTAPASRRLGYFRHMVLRAVERKIEALFEGIFGRAFRTNVQPVELARKLAKEMDDHRTVSVSRVYVPNEYTVYLSPGDREQFESYVENLRSELQEYLSEHARRENYALLSPARVLMETDDDLDVGEFGIATRMVHPERRRQEGEPPADLEPGATMIY